MKTKTQSSFNVRTYVFLILLFLSALTYKVIEPNQLTNYLLFVTAIVCLVIYTIVNTTQPILTKDNHKEIPMNSFVVLQPITKVEDYELTAKQKLALSKIKQHEFAIEQFEKEVGYVPKHLLDNLKELKSNFK